MGDWESMAQKLTQKMRSGVLSRAKNDHMRVTPTVAVTARPTESAEVLVENAVLFDKFHAQNSANRFLEPMQVYDINGDNIFAWLQSVQTSGSPSAIVDFVTTVVKHLRHVSFGQFVDALRGTAIDIAVRIQRESADAVVLVIDGDIHKSNTWVALLVWPFLADVVTHVTDDLNDVPPEIAQNPSKRVFVLQPDDMSYSGLQMSYVLEDVKDWKSRVTFLPVVGFMGVAATTLLAAVTSAFEVPPTVTIIPSLVGLLRADFGDSRAQEILKTLEEVPWNRYYGVYDMVTLIYFDHKLADRVSIPTKLLIDAVSYNPSTDTVETFRLISNCEDAIYKSESGKLIDPKTQFIDLDDGYTCPKAFYKMLRYMFDGKLLGKANSVIKEIRAVLSAST